MSIEIKFNCEGTYAKDQLLKLLQKAMNSETVGYNELHKECSELANKIANDSFREGVKFGQKYQDLKV